MFQTRPRPGRIAAALAALTLIGALLAAAPALARTPAPPAARELVREGNAAYRIGRFDEALAAYEKAYKLFPDPRLLYNLAQCNSQLRHYDRAIFLYQSFLDQVTDTPDRARIEATLKDLRARAEAERMKAPAAPPTAAPSPMPPEGAAPRPGPPGVLPKPEPTPPPAVIAPAPAAGVSTPADPPVANMARPWYARWYVWTVVGLVVAGGVAAGVVLGTRQAGPLEPPTTGLGNMTLFGNR